MKSLIFRKIIFVFLFALTQNLWAGDDSTAVIDINTADIATLQQLDGVGKSRAEAIVKYRETNGPFSSVDELTEVKGIGDSLLEKNRSRLMVSKPGQKSLEE